MARYPQLQPLYDVVNQFKENCLIGNQSLLWPERSYWTLENLYELKCRFIEQDMATKQSFEEKFSIQLKSDNPILWGIASDLFLIYSLPSASLKKQSKLKLIRWAANNGSLSLPPDDNPMWNALEPGFSRTGIQFNRKVGQIAFLILFAIEVKERENPKQIFETPVTFLEFVKQFMQKGGRSWDRAPDMRAALAYMLYPDYFENIISMRDKKYIVDYYEKKLDLELPADIDQAIHQVREKLSSQYDHDGKPFHFYLDLNREWKPEQSGGTGGVDGPSGGGGIGEEDKGGEESVEAIIADPDVLRVQSILQHTKNVILYGPPGTGKTYVANQVARRLIQKQLGASVSTENREEQAIQDLTLHEILALSLYRNGPDKSLSVPELERFPLVRARFRLSPIKNPKQSLWSSLQLHTPNESITVRVQGRTGMGWFDKDRVSRWKLTEEGKNYVKTQLQPVLDQLNAPQETKYKERDFVKWVTFHQSYAYEDFIEGWRPLLGSEDEDHGSFEIRRGVFKAVCDKALNDPLNNYVLVIDEINRGNIAKIMGELITLIEDDKRGFSVDLPYSGDSFCVPSNLFLIGTMNTADRSIALLDVALRRRFAFVEIMPRVDLVDGVQVAADQDVIDLGTLLESLNNGISRLVSRDLQIGHSYFLKVKEVKTPEEKLAKLEFVWNHQVLPLLNEYFYNRPDQLAELLRSFVTSEDNEQEVTQGVVGNFGNASGEDLLAGLQGIIERFGSEQ